MNIKMALSVCLVTIVSSAKLSAANSSSFDLAMAQQQSQNYPQIAEAVYNAQVITQFIICNLNCDHLNRDFLHQVIMLYLGLQTYNLPDCQDLHFSHHVIRNFISTPAHNFCNKAGLNEIQIIQLQKWLNSGLLLMQHRQAFPAQQRKEVNFQSQIAPCDKTRDDGIIIKVSAKSPIKIIYTKNPYSSRSKKTTMDTSLGLGERPINLERSKCEEKSLFDSPEFDNSALKCDLFEELMNSSSLFGSSDFTD